MNFPTDKDSAILQQTVIREVDGSVHLGELTMIPCSMASVGRGNNYQPTPREVDSDAYARTMKKLTGTYPVERFVPDYRQETTPAETTPAAPAETTPAAPAESTPPPATEAAPPAAQPPAPPATEAAPPAPDPAPPADNGGESA